MTRKITLGVVEGWVVTHDGETLRSGFANDSEAAQWLLRRHSYSVDHAVRYEGYDIVLVRGGKVEWSYKRDILGKGKGKVPRDIEAKTFEVAVRQALVDVYGRPGEPGIVARSVRSSYLEPGKKLGWTDPDPNVVLVLTEFGWVQDPYRSKDDHENWERLQSLLRSRGWPGASWDSVNPAVQIVYFNPE